ncbi:LTA synthase family protein [Rheinheimera sp. 4Y26]|uniref:LTA synthase family protein n=1 Tax=Rheinheimera sp. 4Y26 TaxID=2977811 RepID=UPI0021B0FAFA|nr:LTA synthase family protein [Rheinheimera sp. 4Y26]MCT6699254.1 LTA synthase family protein [Rheinheimera sp. 4Y26]
MKSFIKSGIDWYRRHLHIDKISLLLLCLVAAVLCASESLLLVRQFDLFAAPGFLRPLTFDEPFERLLFVLLSAVADIALILFAFSLYLLLLRGKASLRSHLMFMLLLLTALLCTVLLRTELVDYFGGNMDWQVLQNLGGGSGWQAIRMVAGELGIHLLLLLAPLLLLVLLLWLVYRRLERHRLTLLPHRRGWWLLTCWCLLLMLPQLQWVGARQQYHDALEKKVSQQLFAAVATALTDADGDGYGWFLPKVDQHPFDAKRFPGAMDIPGNGIDEDDLFGDLPALPKPEDPLPALVKQAISEQRRPQHLVLVVLESVRADQLFATLNGKAVMPELSAIARQGSFSQQVYSHTGFTTSSLKALFNRSLSSRPVEMSLVQALGKLGYQQNYISGQAEDFGDVAATVGMKQPGHYYFDAKTAIEDRVYPSTTLGSLRLSEDRVVQQVAQRFSELNWQQPQFVYINLQAAHYPYVHGQTKKLLSEVLISRSQINERNKKLLEQSYANAVANADLALGQIRQLLAKHQVLDNSLLVVTADHGESLFDDGFLGHGHQLNDAQTRIFYVSNQQQQLPAVFGHVQMAELMLRQALLLPPTVAEHAAYAPAVLQVVGLIRAPLQIAAISSENNRLVYDFRDKYFSAQSESGDKRLMLYRKQQPELTAPQLQAAEQLLQHWGWLRYQQSDLYHRLKQG